MGETFALSRCKSFYEKRFCSENTQISSEYLKNFDSNFIGAGNFCGRYFMLLKNF